MIVNKREAASLLDISLSKLEDLEKSHGRIPSVMNGNRREIHVKSLIQWESSRKLYEVADKGDFDLTEEKARLAFHQANKTELQAKQLRGELVDAVELESKYMEMVKSFQKNLLNIPSRTSYDLSNLDDEISIREMLTMEIKEALNELSNGELDI